MGLGEPPAGLGLGDAVDGDADGALVVGLGGERTTPGGVLGLGKPG